MRSTFDTSRNPPDGDDQLSLSLYNQHDQSGWAYIFRKFFFDIFAFTASKIGKGPDCEDIVMNTFIAAWGEWKSFVSLSDLKNYLLKIAYHQCVDFWNRKKRFQFEDLSTIQDIPDEKIEGFDAEYIAQFALEYIKDHPNLTKIFEETIVGDKGNKRFAAENNLTETSVAVTKHRIRTTIKQRLGWGWWNKK